MTERASDAVPQGSYHPSAERKTRTQGQRRRALLQCKTISVKAAERTKGTTNTGGENKNSRYIT